MKSDPSITQVIRLQIDGKTTELTLAQAQNLFHQLKAILNIQDNPVPPYNPNVGKWPMQPADERPIYPWEQGPYCRPYATWEVQPHLLPTVTICSSVP